MTRLPRGRALLPGTAIRLIAPGSTGRSGWPTRNSERSEARERAERIRGSVSPQGLALLPCPYERAKGSEPGLAGPAQGTVSENEHAAGITRTGFRGDGRGGGAVECVVRPADEAAVGRRRPDLRCGGGAQRGDHRLSR